MHRIRIGLAASCLIAAGTVIATAQLTTDVGEYTAYSWAPTAP